MTMPEAPETTPGERSPDDTSEGTRDLLFNEICELFRNPEREWTLADELIALLARLGLLNSKAIRDEELERLHCEEKHLRAELSKCDAENNAAGRRAEQAEAEREAQIQRAETAEREITRVEGFCRDQRQRADRAEAAIERAKEIARHPRTSQGRVKDYVDAADILAALDTPTPTKEGSDV